MRVLTSDRPTQKTFAPRRATSKNAQKPNHFFKRKT